MAKRKKNAKNIGITTNMKPTTAYRTIIATHPNIFISCFITAMCDKMKESENITMQDFKTSNILTCVIVCISLTQAICGCQKVR